LFVVAGLSFPVNSVGRLPYTVLNVGMKEKALGMLHNAKQIQVQYQAHQARIEQTSIFFTKFPDITEGLYVYKHCFPYFHYFI